MSTPDELKAISQALAALAERSTYYKVFRDYYNGDHPALYDAERSSTAFGTRYDPGPDNLCAGVVDAVADRLELTGFGLQGRTQQGDPAKGERDRDAGDDAWDLALDNRLEQRAGMIHRAAGRDGDAYLIVWDRANQPGVPGLYPNTGEFCTVIYDDEEPGLIVSAVKRWQRSDKRTRVNVYYRDRIEKYLSKSTQAPKNLADYEPYIPEGETLWPTPNPYDQVPVFHFAADADVGQFGRSDLINAIPSQKRLNFTLANMDMAQYTVALMQRVLVGVEVPIDPVTGKPDINFVKAAYDRVLAIANPDAKGFSFEGNDLRQFIDIIVDARMSVARNTGTPLHYMGLTNDGMTGVAQEKRETRFIKRVKDRQTAFGNTWERAMQLALRIAGKGGDDVRLNAEWVDPSPVNRKEQAETAVQLKTAGVPDEQIWRELGYTDAQVEQWKAEKAQAAAEMRQTMQQAAQPGGLRNEAVQV